MKYFCFSIILVSFFSCVKSTQPKENIDFKNYMEINAVKEKNISSIDNWFSEILEKWNSYNLLTNGLGERKKVIYKTFIANETLNVYDFNDGKTIIGIIDNKTEYLGFAVTRFNIERTDKDWTWFLVVKYKKNNGFWDGLIKISDTLFYEFIHSDMLFLNNEWRKISSEFKYVNEKSIVTIDGQIGKIPIVYIIDNIEETIYFCKIKFIELEELANEYIISFAYNRNIDGIEYVFSIYSDEILFGNLIWNIKTDEIKLELINPINTITGKKWIKQ
jgi:hypothetical protein